MFVVILHISCLDIFQTGTIIIEKHYNENYSFRNFVSDYHTCYKFQMVVREIFLIKEVWKMYRIYKEILQADQGDFKIW